MCSNQIDKIPPKYSHRAHALSCTGATLTHACTCIAPHTRMHSQTRTPCTRTLSHMHTLTQCTHTPLHTRACAHALPHTQALTQVHSHTHRAVSSSHTHMGTHTLPHVHTFTHMHTHMHTYSCTCTYSHIARTLSHSHAYTHTVHTHPLLHSACTLTRTHMHTHSNTHVHMHTYTFSHLHTCLCTYSSTCVHTLPHISCSAGECGHLGRFKRTETRQAQHLLPSDLIWGVRDPPSGPSAGRGAGVLSGGGGRPRDLCRESPAVLSREPTYSLK